MPTRRAVAKATKKSTLRERSRREQEERGSKGEPQRKERKRDRSQGRTLEEDRGRSRRKDRRRSRRKKMRRKVWKNEAEDPAEHTAIRSDRRVRERQRTAKVKKERSNLRNPRARHRVTMMMTPGTKDRPLSLVIHTGGTPPAAGKLTNH